MKKLFGRFTQALKATPMEGVLLAGVVVGVVYFALPADIIPKVLASQEPSAAILLEIEEMQNDATGFGQLPAAGPGAPLYSITVTSTAYNSEPGQTDDSPFITASGTHVRHGVVAANFLPIGTRITIPDLYGDQIFVVEDRMNARYDKRIDVWMESKTDARKYGVKHITVNVYP